MQAAMQSRAPASRARTTRRSRASSARVAPRCAAAPAAADAASPSSAAALPVVFVAGATGRTGVRVVRDLVSRGYTVRAGVRDTARADAIFSGREAPAGIGYTGSQDAPAAMDTSRVTAVRCDVTQPDELAAALGDATVVVSCLGAPESDALNPSLPRAIDGDGAVSLVQASKAAGVRHFVMVSSLGTGKFGWPASILNLFWNVLEHKKRAEDALVASGIPFSIVRPGGMERPTDDYALTHGIVLAPEDTRFGGQVSRAQVAQVCAECIGAPASAGNKVIEVVAEEGVPLRPLQRQLEALPVRVRGVPAPEGTATSFTARYGYKPDPTARLLELMAFGGAAPEVVNGRVAMVAALGVLAAEARGGGMLAAQLDAPALHPWPEAIATGVLLASLPPLLKGVTPRDAQLGPFSAAAELLNGRVAMLGLAAIAVLEVAHGVPVWQHPWPFY